MRKHVSSWILFQFSLSLLPSARPIFFNWIRCVCGMRWFIYSSRERERENSEWGKEIFNTNECVYIWKSNECIFCYHDKNDEFSRISLFTDAHLRLKLAPSNQPRLKQIDRKKYVLFFVSRCLSFRFFCCKILRNPDDINEWKGFDSSAYSIFCAFFLSLHHFTFFLLLQVDASGTCTEDANEDIIESDYGSKY